jgi:hypothetical protein
MFASLSNRETHGEFAFFFWINMILQKNIAYQWLQKKCLPSIFMNLFCWKSDQKKTKSVKLFAWQVEKKYVLLITQK